MAIKEFLDNYRDHIVSLSLLEYKNKENIEELERYSINYLNKRKLNTLVDNVSFLDNSLELIKLDIEKMFYNFYLKLDKLEKLSEGYQKLNTNEASENFIEDFTTFEIKDRNLYDNFLEGLSLPRKHQIKNLLAKSIERNKINVIILIIFSFLVLFFALKDDFNSVMGNILSMNFLWLLVER